MAAGVSRYEHTVGRYMLFGSIGAGGMASVHLGRRVGAGGFARLVAIKRLHPHLAADREIVHSFFDEARLAARINHPNVVSIDDVVLDGDEVLLVMEYVPGRSLSLLASAERVAGRVVPPSIAGAIAVDMLRGLEAAHRAKDERGRELGLIHRDVSPHNVIVGTDGVARVVDFGVAKALGRLQTTATGAIKGKLAYMAPERFIDAEATASIDVYGAAIVVWELLAGGRYFVGPPDTTMIPRVVAAEYRHLEGRSLAAADEVLARALAKHPKDRQPSAAALASDLELALDVASHEEVAAWVERVASKELAEMAAAVEEIEQMSVPTSPRSVGSRPELPPDTVREGSGASGVQSGVPQSIGHADTELWTGDAPRTGSAVVSRAQPRDGTMMSRRLLGTLAVAALVVLGLGGVALSRARAPIAASAPPPLAMEVPPAPVIATAVPTLEPVATTSAEPPKAPRSRPVVAAPLRTSAPPATPKTTGAPAKPEEPEAPADRK